MTTYSFFAGGLFAGFMMTSAAMVVHVPDPSLQQVIRATLKKPDGDITTADMGTLTTLDGSREQLGYAPPIKTLRGLEFATNLHTLSLRGEYNWGVYLGGDPSIVRV